MDANCNNLFSNLEECVDLADALRKVPPRSAAATRLRLSMFDTANDDH